MPVIKHAMNKNVTRFMRNTKPRTIFKDHLHEKLIGGSLYYKVESENANKPTYGYGAVVSKTM